MDMVLAKTDLADRLALRRTGAGRGSCASASSSASRPSTRQTLRCLEPITGADERLAGNPLLARSIQNRFAYLDPLNHLQVELIKRHRALCGRPAEVDERVHRGIHLSINGVAAGLRNTG